MLKSSDISDSLRLKNDKNPISFNTTSTILIFRGQIMKRKKDIEMLLRSNNTDRIPSIKENFQKYKVAEGKDKAAEGSIRTDIKSALENIRSALDYLAHDIAELNKNDFQKCDIYFPYVHPLKKDGSKRSRNEIETVFSSQMKEFKGLEEKYKEMFLFLRSLQGQMWLSELIQSVNPQKHNSLVKLGQKEMHLGSGLIVKGKIDIKPEGKLVTEKGSIKGAFEATPESLMEKRFYQIIEVKEPIDEKELTQLLDKLEEWNTRVIELINHCYSLFP